MSPFQQLILIAIGKLDRLDCEIDEQQWNHILQMAKKHALLGAVFVAVLKLPADQQPPKKIKVSIAVISEKIKGKNQLLKKNTVRIFECFKEKNIDSCVLKGTGIATLYPFSDYRQCGDIDLWIRSKEISDKGRPSKRVVPIVKMLRHAWQVGEVYYHHANVYAFNDGTSLEVHFMPSWMHNPIKNKKLQKFFDDRAAVQMANFNKNLGFAVPDNAFNCVYCAVHIFRHLLLEGIGLRQIMDYYFLLKACTVEEKKEAYNVLCSLGMKRYVASLMFVLQDFFQLEDGYLLCPPDRKHGEFLNKEILTAGNFGLFDSRNSYDKHDSLLKRIHERNSHLKRFLLFAYDEVLWAPLFKTWQHFWRLTNHYF